MSSLLQRLTDNPTGDFTAILGFVITFTIFLIGTWKAIRMNKAKKEHLARLPLESDNATVLPSKK